MASIGEFKVKTSASQKGHVWEDILWIHDTKLNLLQDLSVVVWCSRAPLLLRDLEDLL